MRHVALAFALSLLVSSALAAGNGASVTITQAATTQVLFNGYLALGTALTGGVLAEMPGLPRLALAAVIDNGLLALNSGVVLGPVPAPGGTLSAIGIFDAPSGGVMLAAGTLAPIGAAAGSYALLPPAFYAVTASVTVDPTVLTLGGVPLVLDGQPLQVG